MEIALFDHICLKATTAPAWAEPGKSKSLRGPSGQMIQGVKGGVGQWGLNQQDRMPSSVKKQDNSECNAHLRLPTST
jgi:hypothetical protein